jgi:hypothetical protein
MLKVTVKKPITVVRGGRAVIVQPTLGRSMECEIIGSQVAIMFPERDYPDGVLRLPLNVFNLHCKAGNLDRVEDVDLAP